MLIRGGWVLIKKSPSVDTRAARVRKISTFLPQIYMKYIRNVNIQTLAAIFFG